MKNSKPPGLGEQLPKLATLLEARTALRLSERTFRDLVRSKALRVIALSPRRRGVLVEDLRRYIESRRLGI